MRKASKIVDKKIIQETHEIQRTFTQSLEILIHINRQGEDELEEIKWSRVERE